MKLDSAFSLWIFCQYGIDGDDNRIGPYPFEFHAVGFTGDEKPIWELRFPTLDITIRRNYDGYRARWIPRRPSDETLMLIALAKPLTKNP